jgi:tetratricopeptide (TPR) repeat protein
LPEHHPGRDVLECFARGEVLAAEGRWIEDHLRSGCPVCQRTIDDLLPRLEAVALELPALRQAPRPDRDPLRRRGEAGGRRPAATAERLPASRLLGCACEGSASRPGDRGLQGAAEWAGSPAGPAASNEPADADNQVWDRIFSKLQQRLVLIAAERDGAPLLLAELLAQPAGERRRSVREGRRFRTLALCDLLIEKSFETAFRGSAEAIALAELGILVADLLDVEHYGSAVVHDLRARGWAYLGNARRLRSDFAGAEQALAFAESLSEDGSADPLEEARLLDLEASLLADLGRLEEAAELLDTVIEIYDDVKDLNRQGRALVAKGVHLGSCGWPHQGVELIQKGLALLDGELEPELALKATYNLAWFLTDCGRSARAQRQADSLRRGYCALSDPWAELRLDWLEARIAHGSGRFAEAEERLGRVHRQLADRGLGFEAAMALLDLAILYLEQGKREETRRLAGEALPALLSQDIHRQAAAALLTFQQAAQADRATPALAREITAYLRRARRNPRLAFQRAH